MIAGSAQCSFDTHLGLLRQIDVREENEKGVTDAVEYREKHDNEYP